MIFLGLLAGSFTLLIGGAGVALLMLSRAPRINIAECGCLAWLFGAGLVSLLLWLGGLFTSGLVLQSLVTALCLLLGIVGWRTKQKREARFSLPSPSSRLEWILTTLLVFELITIFAISLKHTLGWDGLFNWEIKARYAFLNGGVLPTSYYSSPGRAFSHPEYPLAVPFTELWLYLWMGVAHQFWIKTVFPIFYIAGVLLMAGLVSRLTGKRWMGLFIAFLVAFVPFVSVLPGGVIVGYVDIPLGMFYVIALGYLLCSLEDKPSYFFAIYVAILVLIPWLKSEGLVLWAVLAFMGVVVAVHQRQLKVALWSILPGLLLILGWHAYLQLVHAVRPSDFAMPTLNLFVQNVDRVANITRIAFWELTETTHWSIFWLLALVAVIYLLIARQLSRLLLASAVVGPLVLYPMIYIFSAWPSYTAHVTSSLPRLFLQAMPAAWLAIALALGPTKARTGEIRS
jgi:hypothetical protein